MQSILSLTNNLYISRQNPVSLVHFVTSRCNARCPFCFIDFDDPKISQEELTLEEIDKLSRALGPDLRNINLTGGEPFIREDLAGIARYYFKNAGIGSIFITSNGSFPDRVASLAESLRSEFSDRKVYLSFSIDAFPEDHNRIRQSKELFNKAISSYNAANEIGGNICANIAITISEENYNIAGDLYETLISKYSVTSITANIVRDEGVYKVPDNHKEAILRSYDQITQNIKRDLKSGRLKGYNNKTLQGRLMNKKNLLVNEIIKRSFIENSFVSPCYAGSLFGVIGPSGTVFPCEILENSFLGNVRDYEYDFIKLWHEKKAQEIRRWISDTKCHCSYECAWSFNVLGNKRYLPSLIAAALGKYW